MVSEFERMRGRLATALHRERVELFRPVTRTGPLGGSLPGEPEPLGPLRCNLQPYSSELARRDYGLEARVTLRLFALPDARLALGHLARRGERVYRIVALPGPGEALLEEIEWK